MASEAERGAGEGNTGQVEETHAGHAAGIGGEERAARGGDRFRGPPSGVQSNLVDVDGRENPHRRLHLH